MGQPCIGLAGSLPHVLQTAMAPISWSVTVEWFPLPPQTPPETSWCSWKKYCTYIAITLSISKWLTSVKTALLYQSQLLYSIGAFWREFSSLINHLCQLGMQPLPGDAVDCSQLNLNEEEQMWGWKHSANNNCWCEVKLNVNQKEQQGKMESGLGL